MNYPQNPAIRMMENVTPSYYFRMSEIYHALNRGVEKRQIFLDDQDRARFVHDMYEFNDISPAGNSYRRFDPMMELRSPSSVPRDPLVDIHGWCLMGNHYHLLLSARQENGVARFLRKLNVGYAMYFNEKYERSGVLFQGRTKKVLIDSNPYFLHILNYIHLNPLDFLEGAQDWRERYISDPGAALLYLGTYRWSSYLDYIGTRNFPSIVSTQLFSDGQRSYRLEIKEYIDDMQLEALRPMLLE